MRSIGRVVTLYGHVTSKPFGNTIDVLDTTNIITASTLAIDLGQYCSVETAELKCRDPKAMRDVA
jgi:hypothetical protein